MLAEIINIKKQQYPDWLIVDLWHEYVEHRKEIKKPLSERSERMALRKLKRLIDAGGDQEDILETAVMNGWQGLFMPDNKQNKVISTPTGTTGKIGRATQAIKDYLNEPDAKQRTLSGDQ